MLWQNHDYGARPYQESPRATPSLGDTGVCGIKAAGPDKFRSGPIDVTKPYTRIWFCDTDGPKPYESIGFGCFYVANTGIFLNVRGLICEVYLSHFGRAFPGPRGRPGLKSAPQKSVQTAFRYSENDPYSAARAVGYVKCRL